MAYAKEPEAGANEVSTGMRLSFNDVVLLVKHA